MKDLYRSIVARDDLQRWLDLGHAPFTIWKEGKALVTLSRLEKGPSVDYLYRIAPAQDNTVSWDSSMLFCGVYDMENRALYLTKDSLSIFMDGRFPSVSDIKPSMTREISGKINQRVESTVNNDRDNLPVRELTGWQAQRELQEYQEFGAKAEALRQFFDNTAPDGQFHSGYAMGDLPEAAFLAYLRDPGGFVQTETEQHLKSHSGSFLLGFMKNDALLAEYQALVQDTGSPIHRMKAITDAVSGCGAKMVTVTVRKAGEELTFKTEADHLKGYHTSYNTYHIPAADRRGFERLFGRYADYKAEDIVKITYGRNTIYEASPAQTEEAVQETGMGGMSFG